MPSRGQQLGRLLNSSGDIVETSLPPKIETFSQSVSNTGKIEAAALGDDVSTIEQVADINSLSASGNAVGDQRVVGNNLYIWNGSGWFRIALINETPTWDSGGQPNGAYVLDSNQNPTVITLAATDPDGFPITFSHVTSGQMDSMATVTQDSSVFTITPVVQDSFNAGQEFTGSITFRASDGVNILPQVSSFTLSFVTSIWSESYVATKVTDTQSSYTRYGQGPIETNTDATHILIPSCEANQIVYWTRSGTTYTRVGTLSNPPTAANTYFGIAAAGNADLTKFLVSNRDSSTTSASHFSYYTRSGSTWTHRTTVNPGKHITAIEMSDNNSYIYGFTQNGLQSDYRYRIGQLGATAMGNWVASASVPGTINSGIIPCAMSGNGNYIVYLTSDNGFAVRWNGSSTNDGPWGTQNAPNPDSWGASTSVQLSVNITQAPYSLSSSRAEYLGFSLNYDGDLMVAGYGDIARVYKRTGTSWSLTQTIDVGGGTRSANMDSTGKLILFAPGGPISSGDDGVRIYETTNTDGTGYALSQSITAHPDESSASQFGNTILSNNGPRISRNGRFFGMGQYPNVNYCYLYLME